MAYLPDPTLGACAGYDVDGTGSMIFSGADMCQQERPAHAGVEADAYDDPDDDQRVINAIEASDAPDETAILSFWTIEPDLSLYMDKSHNLCDWNENEASDQKQKGQAQ